MGAPDASVVTGRGDIDRANMVLGAALTGNASSQFSKEFRLGRGWWAMWLHIAVVVTIGTGTTPLSDGLLRLVRKLFLKTDRGELICNEGARAMWYIAAAKGGTRPQITTLAASNGTYDLPVPIPFADMKMKRPEDTMLDTARYQSLDFEVQLGTTADLFGTPGTSSFTASIDIDVEQTYGALPADARPLFFPSYDHRAAADASAVTTIELEKSADLSIKRFYAFYGDTGTAGQPWSGNANDTYPQRINVQDQERFIEKDRKHGQIQAQNKLDYALETQLAGVEVVDFVKDGSTFSALYTGDKSSLQWQLTQSGAAASSIWTVTHEGIRTLKG